MEQIEEGGNSKEKMDPDMDSSSKHVEELQAEKHDDKDPNVEQNLIDPNSERIVSRHSAKSSRKNERAKFIKKLEAQAKMLQGQVAILKPILESQKMHMRELMEEEKALIQEMKYLQEKTLLRDAENEKNRNRMLSELQKKKQEELVMFNIDPLDPEFNDAPSFQDGGSGSQSS